MNNKYAVVVGIGRLHGENLGGDNDARLMAQILRSHGFAGKNIELLINRKATRRNVIDAIQWLKAKEDSESTVVFFYSGHGGKEFIVLWTGRLFSVQLKSMFADMESRKALFCIQSCYSGSFIDDLQGAGRIVISSTTEDTWSVDDKPLSLWGYWFLDQAMKRKMADADQDGEVSIREAQEYNTLGLMSNMYDGEMIL